MISAWGFLCFAATGVGTAETLKYYFEKGIDFVRFICYTTK